MVKYIRTIVMYTVLLRKMKVMVRDLKCCLYSTVL